MTTLSYMYDQASKKAAYPRGVSEPVDVVHSRSGRTLSITWDDGVVSTLPIHYVRGWCPCAACQGHGPDVRFREHDPALDLELMAEAGAYALHLRFSDGHDSGIFAWTWLRRIAPETPPIGLKRGVFRGGHFLDPGV
jgi:DUF971 family protein